MIHHFYGENINGIKIYNPEKIDQFRDKINKIFLIEPKNLNPIINLNYLIIQLNLE